MKKITITCMLLLAMAMNALADSDQTVTVDGNASSKPFSTLTFEGDNVVVTYSDGTTVTADMESVAIHLSYKAALTDATGNANAEQLATFGGKNVDVKVTRTLNSGTWNTLCLPFDMSQEQIASVFGDGTKVAAFDKAADNQVNFNTVNEIMAGIPYIIEPANTVNSFELESVSLKNLTSGGIANGTDYNFVGVIPETTVSGTALDIAENFSLKPLASTTANSLHAYLLANSSSAAATSFTIDSEVSGIIAIDGQVTTRNMKVFNLQGQYMGESLQGLHRGIYIVNGKKVTIK